MYAPKLDIAPSQKPITLGPKQTVETGGGWDQRRLYWNWRMGSKQTVLKRQMGSKQTVLKLADGTKADCAETGRWDQSRLCWTGREFHAYLVQRFPAVPRPHRAASWRWTEGRWCGSPAAHSGWTVNMHSSRIITIAALLQQNGKNRTMWWLVALHPLLLVQLKCPGFAGCVETDMQLLLSLSLTHTHTPPPNTLMKT